MVTKSRKSETPKTLYLKENRQAKSVSAEDMARRLGIERESVYRLEREPRRLNAEKQARYARALGMEPEELWRPPGSLSLDAMVKTAPENVKTMAADIVRRLLAGANG